MYNTVSASSKVSQSATVTTRTQGCLTGTPPSDGPTAIYQLKLS